MTLRMAGLAGAMGLVVAVAPDPARGQAVRAALDSALEAVRVAWLAHEFEDVVLTSDTLRLQLPGVGRAPAVRPTQAARVLRDYLKSANEITLELVSVRSVDEDHAYAEMVRVYVVQGTADQRAETVFLGFRRVAGQWRLREVRITP